MKILLFEKNEIHTDAVELLESRGFEIIDASNPGADPNEIEAVFIRTYTNIDEAFLDRFPELKYVIRAGVGMDNVNGEECRKRNIHVFNSPGANAHSVAELAIGFTIFLIRKVPSQMAALKNNAWRQREDLGSDITGKIIGVIGCGAVGKLVAKKIRGFEVKDVLGYDPYQTADQLAAAAITKSELGDLLKKSDVIILSIPLTPQTYKLIKLEEMLQMKNTSYLINLSRGGIIDEADLMYALNNKVIAGAALDVFENEPNGIRQDLVACPNLIATPHIGGFTIEGDRAICTAAASNFLHFISA